MTRYVIVGNGAAGIAAAERIRRLDQAGEIIILSAEPYDVYSKCLLPDYLSDQVSTQSLYIRDSDFYQKRRLHLHRNQRVVHLDVQKKQVVTAGAPGSDATGATYAYDKLLIATGSTQVLPPIPGLAGAHPHLLGTLNDAERIKEDAEQARRIVIIGAGFVGLEAAANLYKAGSEVTIIEKAPRVLDRQLDDRAASLLQHALEEEGIRLVLGAAVTAITTPFASRVMRLVTGISVRSVVLEDGRKFSADMLVVATGSRPNLSFLPAEAIKVRRGIVVDPYMRTTAADVYAAGDVVESVDAVSGETTLSPIWPNAVLQGEAAAFNMVGIPRELPDLISMQNACEFREIPTISMGMVDPREPGYEVLCDNRPAEGIYRKLVLKDNIVVGMIFLGDIRNSGVIGGLIRQRTNVARIKANMLNPNFGYSEIAALL